MGYSYTKRFTWTSHWILGFTDGAAVAGAWIAVRGRLDPPAWLLWLAVTVWIAGFDLLYACQDVEFDRRARLHSVPARFGIAAALRAARACHVLTALALAAAGGVLGLGVAYWAGWLVVVALLAYEHSLVSASDLSRLVEVLAISKRCYRVIMFNFWGTIGVDTIGIVLAFFGMLAPIIAALIHVGSELAFILNSARLFRQQQLAESHNR